MRDFAKIYESAFKPEDIAYSHLLFDIIVLSSSLLSSLFTWHCNPFLPKPKGKSNSKPANSHHDNILITSSDSGFHSRNHVTAQGATGNATNSNPPSGCTILIVNQLQVNYSPPLAIFSPWQPSRHRHQVGNPVTRWQQKRKADLGLREFSLLFTAACASFWRRILSTAAADFFVGIVIAFVAFAVAVTPISLLFCCC